MAKEAAANSANELNEAVEEVIRRFVADLDEKNRRRTAGLLALVLGRGGVVSVARVTGLSHTTIERGRGELVRGELGARARIRAPGAGRKPLGKAHGSSPRSRP